MLTSSTEQRPEPSVLPARHQLLVSAAALVGVYLVVFGPGILTSLRFVFGGAIPSGPAGWQSTVTAVEWDVFSVAVVAVVLLRWLPRRAPLVTARMGLGRQLSHPVPGGILGVAAAYVAVALISGRLGDQLVHALHLTRASYPQLGEGTGGFLADTLAGGAAGLTEEITLVALASAVVQQALERRGHRSRWVVPVSIVLLVALRWLVHAYYLWGSLFVLFWVPGVYLLFRWCGSIWPLVIGHVVYDALALAGHAYPTAAGTLDGVLWLVAALGVGALVVSTARTASRRRSPKRAFDDARGCP